MPDLELVAGTLASPYECYQPLYEQMMERGHAVASDITGVLKQDAVPDPEQQDQGWIPTSGGVPRYPGYVFVWHAVLGHWVTRHAFEPEDPRPQMYIGDIADLPTFDNGDANAAGVASGPMWEQWTPITGRVPVGVGLIPGSSPAASVVAPLDTTDSLGGTGEYKHTLTGLEGAVDQHVHPMGNADPGTGDIGLVYSAPVTTPSYNAFGNTGGGAIALPVTTANLISLKANDGNGVTSDPHNNMMPWLGVYWIVRTARIWIVAA